MASRIPLRKTGLVIFSSRIISIFTGMLFIVMVTGWLNVAGFGQWEVILSFVAFASYPASWLGFWATRDVARGRMTGKTVVLLDLVLSIFGTAFYVVMAANWSSFIGFGFGPFLLAVLMVPLGYWGAAASAVAAGHRPVAQAYSLLVSEAAKVTVAYYSLFVLKLGLDGAILAMVSANLFQALVTTGLTFDVFSSKLDLDAGKRWLHDSWVPVVYALPSEITTADTVIASAVGGYVLAGYYQAAFQIGSLVGYAGYLSGALYPLLLRGGSDDAPDKTLDLILLFGIPMTAGVIVLAPQLLGILSSQYVSQTANVSPALGVLGVAGLALAVSTFLDSIIIAKERADLLEGASFSTYISSGFSYVSKVNIGYAAVYVVSVYLAATLGTGAGVGMASIVLAWAISQLSVVVAASAIKLRRVRKVARLSAPRAAVKYVGAAAVMAIVILALSALVPSAGLDRLEAGARVSVLVVAGGGAYFGLLYAVDANFRRLAMAAVGSR